MLALLPIARLDAPLRSPQRVSFQVKGRTGVGSVSLSLNEWFKAKGLGDDYYLYVVWNTANNPDKTPKIIQNPASVLTAKENVHFIISQTEIEEKAKDG